MLPRRSILLAGCVLALVACNHTDGRELPPPRPDQNQSIRVTTTVATTVPKAGPKTAAPASGGADGQSTVAGTDPSEFAVTASWADGGVIPLDNGCSGADRSPKISWTGLPEGTLEVAVVLTDLDTSSFAHWIAWGLDPASGGVAEGQSATIGSQALNGFGKIGYGGPCPPSGTHTYQLQVYAEGEQLEITNGAAAADALSAIQSAALDSVGITGTYAAS